MSRTLSYNIQSLISLLPTLFSVSKATSRRMMIQICSGRSMRKRYWRCHYLWVTIHTNFRTFSKVFSPKQQLNSLSPKSESNQIKESLEYADCLSFKLSLSGQHCILLSSKSNEPNTDLGTIYKPVLCAPFLSANGNRFQHYAMCFYFDYFPSSTSPAARISIPIYHHRRDVTTSSYV